MKRDRQAGTSLLRAGNLRALVLDTLHILAGLWIWNIRKTAFRLGAHKRCPCMAQSDSGRPGESRCEASFLLERPTRFAIVCPALHATPAGWRCRHARETVRPYWGRALFIYGMLLASLWVAATTAWFGALRFTGVSEVAWLDCVWPPRHEKVGVARAARFREQFTATFRRGDIPASIIALHSAFTACDTCWRDGLLLAQLYERTGQFAAADHIFDQVEQRPGISPLVVAIARHDALLHSRRYRSLAELAWRELQPPSDQPSVWLTPLVFALQADPLAATVLPADLSAAALDAPERLILELATAERITAPLRNQVLASPMPSPALAILRWQLLLEHDQRLAALNAARQDQAVLGEFETKLARWATIDPRTPPAQAAQWWTDLLPLNPTPAHIARLCAVALRSPFAVPLSALRVRVNPRDRASLSALWVVALKQRDEGLAVEILHDLGVAGPDTAVPVDAQQLQSRLPLIATLLPIPRDVLYALMPHAAGPAHLPAEASVDDLLTGTN